MEKWLLLGQEDTFKEAALDTKIKEVKEKCETILRPSVAPSYPFYILTVAQSVDDIGTNAPVLSHEDRGSFGFFYEWLITTSLHRPPIKIHDVSLKYRYLSELAYHMHQNKVVRVDSYELESFHTSYLQTFKLRYIDLPYEDIVIDITRAGMIKAESGYFEFRYPYIYYYFIARALNSRLQKSEYESQIKETISQLAAHIDTEENENILLFLSYLSENPYIRNTILQAAKEMFSHNDPTDLDNDVAFINRHDFNVPMQLPEEKPRRIRELIDEKLDQERRKRKLEAENKAKLATPVDEEEIDEAIKAITRGYRMVRILGHVVKNFATSLEGPEKYPITEEVYLLGLRVLKEILTRLALSYDAFLEQVKDTIKYAIEKEMIKLPPERKGMPTDAQLNIVAKATAFVRAFLITSDGIIAVARHVGTVKLYPIYREILENYNYLLPVRLIDIAIKLESQAQLPLEAMSKLLDDLDKNPIGKSILRRMAYNRLTLYEADRSEKERCCRMFDIRQDNPRLYSSSRKIVKI